MANKIHLNIAKRDEGAPELKMLEVGLCGEEVYNAELVYFFDELPMGFWHEENLLHIRNVCRKCIRLVREQTPEKIYVTGFRASEGKEIPGEL